MFILRKHDFSRKLTGGTGLQGVSSNLNLDSQTARLAKLPNCQTVRLSDIVAEAGKEDAGGSDEPARLDAGRLEPGEAALVITGYNW